MKAKLSLTILFLFYFIILSNSLNNSTQQEHLEEWVGLHHTQLSVKQRLQVLPSVMSHINVHLKEGQRRASQANEALSKNEMGMLQYLESLVVAASILETCVHPLLALEASTRSQEPTETQNQLHSYDDDVQITELAAGVTVWPEEALICLKEAAQLRAEVGDKLNQPDPPAGDENLELALRNVQTIIRHSPLGSPSILSLLEADADLRARLRYNCEALSVRTTHSYIFYLEHHYLMG